MKHHHLVRLTSLVLAIAVVLTLGGPGAARADARIGAELLSKLATALPWQQHGRHDYVVPYVLWDGIPDRLPDATFRLFERSGHQPFFEEPEEFTAALMDWVIRKR